MCGLKGHSALRPCWCCANVVLRKFFTRRMSANFVDHTCIHRASVVFHTAQSFRDTSLRLEDVGLHSGPGALHELEITHGVRWVPNGLLYATALNITPLNQMLDWCHVYLCGGLVDVELGLLMAQLRRSHAPTSYAALGQYVALWKWPKQYGRHGTSFAELFNKKNAKANLESESFSSSASELLSLIPVLELYFDRVAKGQGVFVEGVTSILLVFNVVDLLQSTRSRNSTVTGAALAAAIQVHMEAFYAAYGKDAGRPKHHTAALHLADHYKRWGRLAPCFTHERFHKLAKSYASTRRNTTSYERGIIEDIAVSQICSNEEATFGFIGLVKPVKPTQAGMQRFRNSSLIPRDAEVLVGRVYSTGFARVATDDVAFSNPLMQLRSAQSTHFFP